MANSPGGSDRPADNNDAPTDNDSITNTPSANSVTSGPNHAEIHVPARRFDAAGSMAYIGFFAHAQAMSKSCGTPEGTVSLAEIENQDDAGDENNGQPDNNVAATDKVEPLAHKPSAFEPAGSSVPRQVFYSAEDAANNNTEASDKVEKYVRIRGEKQLALQAHQRQLNDAREKVKEQQDQLDNASLTEEERLEVEGRRAVERGHLNKHLGNV